MKNLHPFNAIASITLMILSAIFVVIMLVLQPVITEEDGHVIVGMLVTITSFFEIAAYLFSKSYKQGSKLYILIISGSLLIFGVVSMLASLPITSICLIWGIGDALTGVFGGIRSSIALKKEKIQIVDLIISIGFVVFGIILAIKLQEGIKGHLIFCSIAYLVDAIIMLIEFIKTYKYRENPMTNNN